MNMISNLVFLGCVIEKQSIVGVKLIDVVKKESNLISRDSFEQGVKNGIKILNVSYINNSMVILGGANAYTLYNRKNDILKLGLDIEIELDNKKWILLKPNGDIKTVNKLSNSNNTVRILNQASKIEEKNELDDKNDNIVRNKKDTSNYADNKLDNDDKVIFDGEYTSSNANRSSKKVLNIIDMCKYKSDLDVIKKLNGDIDYVNILENHIRYKIPRGFQGYIDCGPFRFLYEKGNYVACSFNEYKHQYVKVRSFTKFKIKTIAAMTLKRGQASAGIALLSDEVYDDGHYFTFKGILVNTNYYNIPFALGDIIYIRDKENWYGNRDNAFRGLETFVPSIYNGEASIELMILYNNGPYKLLIIVASQIEKSSHGDLIRLHVRQIKLSKQGDFLSGGNILNTMASNILYRDNILKGCQKQLFDSFSYLDLIKEKIGAQRDNSIRTMRISEVDNSDSLIYEECISDTKDKANLYSSNRAHFIMFNGGLKDYEFRNIYHNDIAECNVIVNYEYRKCNRDSSNRSAIKEVVTGISEKEFKEFVENARHNIVYTNIPISEYGHYYTDGLTRQRVKYCIITDGDLVHFVDDKKHNLGIMQISELLRYNNRLDILDRYKGMTELQSVAYLAYRAVLKYDNSIPRCKEQYMLNGEIEDLLEDIVLEEVVDEKNNIVKVYAGRFKITMKLDVAKKRLMDIYNTYIERTEGVGGKKLDIMKVVAGIQSINGNLILNDDVSDRNIAVPDIIKGLIIDKEQLLLLSKLTLSNNVSIDFKSWGSLRVRNLELKGKANNMIQKYSKTNSRLIYEKCNIHDISISGRTLYDLFLTMLIINELSFPNRIVTGKYPKESKSKEENLVTYAFIGTDTDINKTALGNLIEGIHKVYSIDISEKSMLSLVKYLEGNIQKDKCYSLMKTTDVTVGRYLVLLGYVLLSYSNIDRFCCNSILRLGQELVDKSLVNIWRVR